MQFNDALCARIPLFAFLLRSWPWSLMRHKELAHSAQCQCSHFRIVPQSAPANVNQLLKRSICRQPTMATAIAPPLHSTAKAKLDFFFLCFKTKTCWRRKQFSLRGKEKCKHLELRLELGRKIARPASAADESMAQPSCAATVSTESRKWTFQLTGSWTRANWVVGKLG